MPIFRFLRRRQADDAASALYSAVVTQARQPAFYSDLGVADTLEGRYDMVILHAYMIFRRLALMGNDRSRHLAQQTFDLMFTDMDRNLREMGVTDTGVGKRIRRMAEAFYGRATAYDRALDAPGRGLQEALGRNLFQGQPVNPEHEDRMASYLRVQLDYLATQSDAALLAGEVTFSAMEA